MPCCTAFILSVDPRAQGACQKCRVSGSPYLSTSEPALGLGPPAVPMVLETFLMSLSGYMPMKNLGSCSVSFPENVSRSSDFWVLPGPVHRLAWVCGSALSGSARLSWEGGRGGAHGEGVGAVPVGAPG